MKRKEKIVLVVIFLLSFLLRVWQVGSYPPLLWDEAALGYNAYSILHTGRDEYGKFMPLIFKSFGDYKPGLYVYLAMPFVWLFGLTPLAVRLPSIIFGAFMPLGLYFLVRQLWDDERLASWSAVVLAFLPAAIHFSRGAWEVNIMTGFLLLGSWFLLRKPKHWSWGLASFLLALLTYQGAKLLVPLLLLFFVWLYGRSPLRGKLKIKKTTWLFSGVIVAAMAGWYLLSFSGPARNRLRVMSLFSYHRPSKATQAILQEDGLTHKNWHFYVFHGEWLAFTRAFADRYLNYFSPRFLAFAGDWTDPRHSAPYFGFIGHLNFLLMIIGLAFFLARPHPRREYLPLYWFLVAPLPAALSRDIISGVRSLPIIIPVSIFIGWGIKAITDWRPLFAWKKIFAWLKYGVLGLLFFLDFFYWSDLYFVHMVKRRPKDWLYGYRAAMKYVIKHKNRSQQVFFTNFYGQPYIYYLFYSHYPPAKYQKQAHLQANKFGDVGRVNKIDNLYFCSLDKGTLHNCQNCLLLFADDEILRSGIDKDKQIFSQMTPLGKINHQVLFYAYQTGQKLK